MEDFNKGADGITKAMLITTVIVLLTGLYGALRFMRSITQPLGTVIEGMHQVERGLYERIPELNQKDEIGEMEVGFNHMIDAIGVARKEIVQNEALIRSYAYYDAMSGLPNVNFLRESVTSDILSGIDNGILILLSIKDFDTISSIHGHEYMGQIIRSIGQIFQMHRQNEKEIAHIDSDKFAAWICNYTGSDLQGEIQRRKEKLVEEIRKVQMDIQLDFYISYATYPSDGNNYDALYQRAAVALQFARTQYDVLPLSFKREMHIEMEKEDLIRRCIKKGLEHEEFFLNYQEKTDIKTEKTIGVEALARWNSRELGEVNPSTFIPVMNRANMMHAFSEYIFVKVLQDFEKLQKKYGRDITVSINISPTFFFRDNFIAFITQQLERYQIAPEAIILEITEDVFISEFEVIRQKVKLIRDSGIRVSLDDFGTGYSSLNYLANIDFDEIKIDKSFIDFLGKDPRASNLFQSIVQIADVFDYKVIAEGIETQEQLEMVRRMGCHMVQGYYFSKPEPI